LCFYIQSSNLAHLITISALKGVKVADKVLVIDDDPSVAELIKLILKPRGLVIYHAPDGKDGLKQAYDLQPDLILLDIMMPEHDGYEICARLREFSDVPILMLTAKSQSSDVTHGFAVGADDYVKKPFSNEELVSRIESLLRRNKSTGANKNITGYSDGTLEVELASQKVLLDGEEITLTPTEFKLLAFLIRNPNKTLPTRTLLTEIWGDAYSHDKALLSLYIHQIRQKLKEGEAEHKYIQTQWGQGYLFKASLQNEAATPISVSAKAENLEKPKTIPTFFKRWWIVLAILLLLLVALQIDNLSKLFTKPIEDGTLIEAIVTSDGFIAENGTGVHGQVCISNQGEYSTENLSIVSTVQTIDDSESVLTNRSIDLGKNPIIEPNKSHCYPYEMIFEPIGNPNVTYMNTISVTITNFSGLAPGSKHCPGPDRCSFGPTIKSEFSLPEQ
jgi:DNA-binding response OmpR family regulator